MIGHLGVLATGFLIWVRLGCKHDLKNGSDQ